MTRKESLLKQLYEIENASATLFLNREAPHNIERMEASGRLGRDAQKYTVAELEDKIAGADREFQSYRRKSAHEAWLKTQEGQEAEAEFKAQVESLRDAYAQAKEQVTRNVDGILAQYGPTMHVHRMDDSRAEIAVGEHQFDRFDVYFDTETWGERKPKFEVNVGTTGSFSLCSDRCDFYTQMGAFLGSADAYTVRQLLLDWNDFTQKNREKYFNLRKEFDARGTENL